MVAGGRMTLAGAPPAERDGAIAVDCVVYPRLNERTGIPVVPWRLGLK